MSAVDELGFDPDVLRARYREERADDLRVIVNVTMETLVADWEANS